jgi:hypothetical protein
MGAGLPERVLLKMVFVQLMSITRFMLAAFVSARLKASHRGLVPACVSADFAARAQWLGRRSLGAHLRLRRIRGKSRILCARGF